MKTEFRTDKNKTNKEKQGAGASGAFFACGLRNRRNTCVGTTLLEGEINRMAEAYASYGDLYKEFRKIRHDFANYVQTIQLLQDEESRQTRKAMKKEIIQKVGILMPKLEQTCAWKQLMQSREQKQADAFAFMREHEVSPMLQSLWQQWEWQKTYFVHLDEELPQIKDAIWKIKDKLECSLDPDEREIDELLEGCDRFKKQIDVADPILASLIVDKMQKCRQAGIDFRFKLSAPDTFTLSHLELLGLYGCLLDEAIEAAAASQVEHPLVRIRTGEQYGLWHLHVEYVPASDSSVQALKQMNKNQKTKKKLVKRICKKHRAKIKYKSDGNQNEIDVMR